MISLQNNKGVLLGAESRANIFNETNRPIAYFDKTQKVFLLNDKFGVVTTGSDLINNKFVSKIIVDYKTSHVDLLVEIDNFVDYLKRELVNIGGQSFIFCGLDESRKISRYIYQQDELSKIDDYLEVKSINSSVVTPSNWKNASQKEMIRLSKEIIEDYKNQNYADGTPASQRVGGPIDFLWLSNNGKFRWIVKKNAKVFSTKEDFKKWIMNTDCKKVLVSKDEFIRVVNKL